MESLVLQNPTEETGRHTLDIPVGAGSDAVYLWNVGTGELPESARFPEVTKESHFLLEDAAISDDGSSFAAVEGDSVFSSDREGNLFLQPPHSIPRLPIHVDKALAPSTRAQLPGVPIPPPTLSRCVATVCRRPIPK